MFQLCQSYSGEKATYFNNSAMTPETTDTASAPTPKILRHILNRNRTTYPLATPSSFAQII
jgi:hypothetical protein